MSNNNSRPVALVILDGWGYSPRTDGNAIALAHTPYYDDICARYPRTLLAASGPRVGLPPGESGNPEVGHMNIGAGRIVQTDISRINNAIKSGEFLENETLKSAFAKAREDKSSVHLIGLLSDGGVHSSPESLFALLRMAKREGLNSVFVHCFLDGRDVQPRTADIYVEALELKIADIGLGRIATLCGRFFAMDGEENWERTARAYTMLVHSEGERTFDAGTAIRNSFLRGISDEFIAPIVIEQEPNVPVAAVKDGDLVVFFNHRPDTMRQLVRSLAVRDSRDKPDGKPRVNAVCLTEYDSDFELPVAFRSTQQDRVMAQVLAERGIVDFRISESVRQPHVTHIFNGGAMSVGESERHIVLASPSCETFETQPELKSFKISNEFIQALESEKSAAFVINLPAANLLAETGNFERTVEALQYMDTCLGGIVEKIREAEGVVVITSSHGNCEEMFDLVTGQPNPFGNANPVPFHLVDDGANKTRLRAGGSLEDVAPTILSVIGIEKPAEMTGRDLRII